MNDEQRLHALAFNAISISLGNSYVGLRGHPPSKEKGARGLPSLHVGSWRSPRRGDEFRGLEGVVRSMNIVEFLEGEIIRDEMRDVMYQPHDESCDYPGDEPGVCTCFRNAVEVEAKRQILALHKMSKSKLFATGKTRPGFCETCAFGQSCDCCFDYDDENLQSLAPCPTLRILASVYRDRPGWQEEWAS